MDLYPESQSPPGGVKTEPPCLLESGLSVAGLNEKERRAPRAQLVAKTYDHLDYIKDRRVSTEVDEIGQAGRTTQHRILGRR